MPIMTESCRRLAVRFDERARARTTAFNTVAVERSALSSSLDADFDRTERGRKTPADVLKQEPERH